MATLREDSALNALNEKDYINKLYDTNNDSAKKLLEESYGNNTGFLNAEQNRVQQETQENVNRTQVEAQTAQDKYTGPQLSYGASQQEALNRSNARQSNVTSLQQKESEIDAEINRQRQLLASQYETAIKQAQAENDMLKAQQLYNAAKEEEAKLLELRKNASTILAGKGDVSIREALLKGETPTADYSGTTWDQVLKNEGSINEIYDKQMEAERLGLQSDYDAAVSDLMAKQQQREAETDKKLTQSYVDALRKMKNYAEVQNAYGQGSGTAAAARIAQDTELQQNLTNLRLGQMDAAAGMGMEGFDIGKDYREKLYGSQDEINKKRAEELLKAAEKEEATLYDTQLQLGQQLAKQNDWSVLGKLYGLTQDQIDRIQGTGAYAPSSGGGDDGGGSRGRGSDNLIMRAAQDALKYGAQAAIDAVNSTNASQAVKNAAIQNAQGAARTQAMKGKGK